MSNAWVAEWSARAVKEAITRSGLTKRAIADETRIPYPTLNRKLAGRAEFRLSELYLLAEATGVPPSRFIPPELPPSARSR